VECQALSGFATIFDAARNAGGAQDSIELGIGVPALRKNETTALRAPLLKDFDHPG
jgi:hypothetical protein